MFWIRLISGAIGLFFAYVLLSPLFDGSSAGLMEAIGMLFLALSLKVLIGK